MKLTELLEKLEAAEGSDRDIDYLLHRYVAGWDDHDYYWTHSDGRQVRYTGWPPYTSSIDAAVALCEQVLPELNIRLDIAPKSCNTIAVLEKRVTWTDTRGRRHTQYREVATSGLADDRGVITQRTPALALCTAIVKAKIAEAE